MFVVNDKVKCIRDNWGLKIGEIYTVYHVQEGILDFDWLHLKEVNSVVSFASVNFEKV